jgi:hypothetical protein
MTIVKLVTILRAATVSIALIMPIDLKINV